MSRTAARFTQADLARAVRAAKSVGDDMAVDLRPDGTIRIFRLVEGPNAAVEPQPEVVETL